MLATSCGCSKETGTKINPSKLTAPGKFYLEFYQRELNAVWSTKTAAINAAANNVAANHEYDLQLKVLSEVLTKVKADGAAEFKRAFPGFSDYNGNIFDDIAVSFTIPDDSKGNLKVASDGKLTIYPTNILSGANSEKHINYTLKLNSSKIFGKELSGSLKFSLNAGFINYNDSTSASKLPGNVVQSIYGNTNLSTILVGSSEGLTVGTKQAGGGYAFTTTYNRSGSGKKKLADNFVTSVTGTADLSTILVGEQTGGLDVGTKQADGSYDFINYTSGSGKPLARNSVLRVYGNANMSEILVGEQGGGMDVGTKQGDNSYKFVNYSTTSTNPLNSNVIYGLSGNTDMSEILVGGLGAGLDVGTRASASDLYTFTNYNSSSPGNKKLASNVAISTYGTADLSTILVGTFGGLSVGTKQGDGSYAFTNYTGGSGNPLADNKVQSVYGNADLSTILVGTQGGGLDVGTKDADGNYTFANYNTTNGLANNYVYSAYGNADLSTVFVGALGGVDITSNLWFA